jgi:hypothetical protein
LHGAEGKKNGTPHGDRVMRIGFIFMYHRLVALFRLEITGRIDFGFSRGCLAVVIGRDTWVI